MAKLTERTSFTKDVEGRYLCNDVLASGADPESRRTQHFSEPLQNRKI
jgi:hypothetical protein